MITINREEFLQKYKEHQEWLDCMDREKRLVWYFKINFKFDFNFRMNLSWANLSGADLSWANLSGANLFGANLSEAKLSEANLSGADLSGADLSEANLSGANLSGANLFGADLSWAKLSEANLSGANLSGAKLSEVNLFGANLSEANLDYSSWGLSCKTKNVILCKNLQAQLLGHVMNVSPEIKFTKEQVQFVRDNWSRFDEFCNDEIKELLL